MTETSMITGFASAVVVLAAMVAAAGFCLAGEERHAGSYDDLVTLFAEWREFERPPLLNGAPDYTASQFSARQPEFLLLRERLHSIDSGGWSIAQRVDWQLVRAEMNGSDFNQRVLQP